MKLLKKLYRISSPSNNETEMLLFIKSLLKGANISFTQDNKGNIYATKGEANEYPCVVCHVDEVHKVRKSGYKVVETDGILYGINTQTMSYEGIGADDKNGIWVCLNALSEFDIIKCAFFVAEEVGCIGSNAADMTFFEDCRFVLQCDRKGNSDFITNASCTELCSDEFLKDANIGKFGYKEANGMMTDVMTLKEKGLSVSACNISCGYYNPHSNNEMTRFSDLENCYALVKNIILTCTKVYPHEYTAPKYGRYGVRYGGGMGSYWDDFYGYRGLSKSTDKTLSNLRKWYPDSFKDGNTYKVFDYKTNRYRAANKEELYYADHIEKYEGLYQYYDEVKFNKKGEPIVKDFKEKSFHAPDKFILDKVLGEDDYEAWSEEYNNMSQDMYDCAIANQDSFSLDSFKDTHGVCYPNMTNEDYATACEEVLGCLY